MKDSTSCAGSPIQRADFALWGPIREHHSRSRAGIRSAEYFINPHHHWRGKLTTKILFVIDRPSSPVPSN